MDISQIEKALAAIIAVGALGTAAFGVVEAFGKALVVKGVGLPYAGFGYVKALVADYGPALRMTYGEHYKEIVQRQYRDGRAKGQAPDSLRQGVRLALPLMEEGAATALIGHAWGLGDDKSAALARALISEQSGAITPTESETAAVLAGRFALAVDARIVAAFSLAEERYQAFARCAAGLVAIALSLFFNYAAKGGFVGRDGYPWMIALIIGLAAVPLAPIAKDLSSALSDSLRAWRQVGGVKV
ncbi:hypothetical protein [Phenylobacterium sp.]|uniref:hypothetical protein n=1 Tax=Phenylobacterium sp. TaxID=1871053 RepID=UPI0027371FFF|nr:hypothetical protein [Phenylobacterium sp.]MDP3660463.1 hypothetical protein [Phenylobacterium sp.]